LPSASGEVGPSTWPAGPRSVPRIVTTILAHSTIGRVRSGCTVPDPDSMDDGVATLLNCLDEASVEHVVIGGHAVNAWLEPRFTADVDVTVHGRPAEIERLKKVLESRGYRVAREYGAELPSGPDFVRFVSEPEGVTLEVQMAKTEFQREVLRRAAARGRPRIATPEDLIVMKLIANRAKDQLDLLGLVRLDGLDWKYVEAWATEWEVAERLRELRAHAAR
jgi:hypothetical protein